MTDPTSTRGGSVCRDCGKTGLVWSKTKAGYPVLYELRRHKWVCKKKQPKVEDSAVVVALVENYSYGVRKCREAVKGLEGDFGTVFAQALKRLAEGDR